MKIQICPIFIPCVILSICRPPTLRILWDPNFCTVPTIKSSDRFEFYAHGVLCGIWNHCKVYGQMTEAARVGVDDLKIYTISPGTSKSAEIGIWSLPQLLLFKGRDQYYRKSYTIISSRTVSSNAYKFPQSLTWARSRKINWNNRTEGGLHVRTAVAV
jgi:hypothetical protein